MKLKDFLNQFVAQNHHIAICTEQGKWKHFSNAKQCKAFADNEVDFIESDYYSDNRGCTLNIYLTTEHKSIQPYL